MCVVVIVDFVLFLLQDMSGNPLSNVKGFGISLVAALEDNYTLRHLIVTMTAKEQQVNRAISNNDDTLTKETSNKKVSTIVF